MFQNQVGIRDVNAIKLVLGQVAVDPLYLLAQRVDDLIGLAGATPVALPDSMSPTPWISLSIMNFGISVSPSLRCGPVARGKPGHMCCNRCCECDKTCRNHQLFPKRKNAFKKTGRYIWSRIGQRCLRRKTYSGR